MRLDHIDKVLFCLPEDARKTLAGFFTSSAARQKTTEIRLRSNMPASVTCGDKNISLFSGREIILTPTDMAETVSKLCEESVHTYGSSINEGYITLCDGLRIGVCGKARHESGRVISVREITSAAVRIPHIIHGVCSQIMPLIVQGRCVNSALIYSLPGVGKTTLIRDIASVISKEWGRRVCVVDSRGEIYIREMFAHSICDFLDGYPKGVGIEIATRTMSPQCIVCDEIGDGDAEQVLCAQNSGVPLIATAHGGDMGSLLLRPGMKKLYDAGVFRYYIGISRGVGTERFSFDIKDIARRRE